MKKILFAALLSSVSLSAMAEDYQYLTVATGNAEQSLQLATIQKITFDTEAGNILVTTTEGIATFPITEMEKMYFSTTPTAVKALPVQSEGLKVDRNVVFVQNDGMLRIYNASGVLQCMAPVKKGNTVSLDNLSKGLYIINLGNQSIKVLR